MSARIRPDLSKLDAESRKLYRKSCEKKNAYPTPACALIHCFDRKREADDDLWPYGPCRFCGHFHTGHATGKVGRDAVMRTIESLLEMEVLDSIFEFGDAR